MVKQINLNVSITNRALYTFLAILSVLLITGIAFAYGTNDPKTFGHSSGEVEIRIGNTNYTLQQAIDQGLMGGVKVKTGVAAHKEILMPIAGFNKSDCQIMVSANFLSVDDYTGRSDIPTIIAAHVKDSNTVSEGWQVIAKAYKEDDRDVECFLDGGGSKAAKKCGANYIIVCGSGGGPVAKLNGD